jgi:glutaredoxin-like protein NrdH
MEWIDVVGESKGDVVLYALSTCGWCRKTKRLLDELGVQYRYKYVDMAFGAEKDEVLEQVERWNPHRSFPTLVFDDEKAIVGYKPDKIKEALGL